MERSKFTSIIITHYAMNSERSELLRESINSLIENTEYPFELIVVDNGKNDEDTEYLLNLNKEGKINFYIRNANNMHFAWARNQGMGISTGDYICIADNDIRYFKGWLKKCVGVLEAFPDKKIYATPFAYPMVGLNSKYHKGYINYKDENYELNMRAGSNCFVIRREDMLKIGPFAMHRIAGSLWTDSAVRAGYDACVLPTVFAEDMGLRRGYNLKQSIPIKITLSDGTNIHFNKDEFRKLNPEAVYYE